MCRGLLGKSYFYTYSPGVHVEDIKIILLNNDRDHIPPGLTLHLFFQTSQKCVTSEVKFYFTSGVSCFRDCASRFQDYISAVQRVPPQRDNFYMKPT